MINEWSIFFNSKTGRLGFLPSSIIKEDIEVLSVVTGKEEDVLKEVLRIEKESKHSQLEGGN